MIESAKQSSTSINLTVIIRASHPRIRGPKPVEQFIDQQNEVPTRRDQVRVLLSDELQEIKHAESHGGFKQDENGELTENITENGDKFMQRDLGLAVKNRIEEGKTTTLQEAIETTWRFALSPPASTSFAALKTLRSCSLPSSCSRFCFCLCFCFCFCFCYWSLHWFDYFPAPTKKRQTLGKPTELIRICK